MQVLYFKAIFKAPSNRKNSFRSKVFVLLNKGVLNLFDGHFKDTAQLKFKKKSL